MAPLWLLLIGLLCTWSSYAAGEEGTCLAGETCGTEGTSLQDGQPKPGAQQAYYWPRSRGHHEAYASTRLLGPTNLSAALAWSWEPQGMQILPGGVLLDGNRNIYVSSCDGLRKFTATGENLWFYPPTSGISHANPSMANGALYGATNRGHMFAVDMETGKELWSHKYSEGCEMDSPYVEVWDGVVLSACGRRKSETFWMPGNMYVVAVQASDGQKLWDWHTDRILWNFMPMFPGDGSFITMDVHGGLYRLSVKTGKLIWRAREPAECNTSFTDGGAILSPGGRVAYTCSNLGDGRTDDKGALRAYQVSTGKLLWEEELPQPCVSWPAVDPDNQVVVVPLGSLPLPIPPTVLLAPVVLASVFGGLVLHFYVCFVAWLCRKRLAKVRRGLCCCNVFSVFCVLALPLIHWFSCRLDQDQHRLWFAEPKPLLVCAFDAESGVRRWCFDDIPHWGRINARRDEEEAVTQFFVNGHYERPVCGPASWSAPTIDGRGTVYVSGLNGIFYAIRDANEDGIIDNETEVSTLDVEFASLHPGTSFAPGMMVLGTCRRVYVFNTSA